MITSVCFDVRGSNADALQEQALRVLQRFDNRFTVEGWTIHIEAAEETISGGGEVVTWRGEVTARRHDVL